MRSIWLALLVLSVVLAKAEDSSGSGYELIICILETLQRNSEAMENNLSTITARVDQLVVDQHLIKSTMQNFSRSMEENFKSVVRKVDQSIDDQQMSTRTAITKIDQLIDVTVAGEPRCPTNASDGVYKLKPIYSSIPTFSVYCENGWIVIHRRFDGSLEFNQTWGPYREGFGDLQGEYWLGLEKMHQITRVGSYELKVVLKSFDDVVKTAKYEGFKIDSEIEQYRLNLQKFVEGDAGDSFMYHEKMKFSTEERDNDQSTGPCAGFNGGWWFKNCFRSHLNGIYEKGKEHGMTWFNFKDDFYCLKEARMMIRAVKSNE